jgi:Na+/proline symporter
LGGKGYGSILLFMTLFSTIYSGYTVVGVPNEAVALGYFALRWVSSAPMVQVATIIFVPRLRRLSVARNYNSPNDIVSDRFNNRILTVLTSISVVAPQLMYVIAQFFTLKNLIPVLSLGMMDEYTTVWFFALVIYVCESLGGFDAVSLTDSVQSTMMIASLICIPIIATYYYGGAGSSTPINCPNKMEVICTVNGTLTAAASGVGCLTAMSKNLTSFSNGCLGSMDVAPWLTLHPSTGMSDFFKPAWGAGVKGIDVSEYYSNTGMNILSFNILFMAFFLNPHWMQRTFAAKTDASIKKANIAFTFAALVATLPGVLVGIMIKANITNFYAPGAEPFSTLLSEFMNRGGFPEFVAVIASCSAIAAIMSTADSAIIGVTNVLSMDFMKNWLFINNPNLDTPKFMSYFSKITSAIICLIGVTVALYDDALNTDKSVYGRMISWQNMLLWQAVPTVLLGLFFKKVKAWALVIGYLVGYGSIIGFYLFKESTICGGVNTYGTPFAGQPDADGVCVELAIKTFYLDSAVWAGFINLFVSFVLSFLPFPENSSMFAIDMGGRHGEGILNHDKILEIMKGTTEPIFTKIGAACILMTTLLVNGSIPFWGTQYDGCSFFTYRAFAGAGGVAEVAGCSGGVFDGTNIPQWATVMIACFVVALFCNVTAFIQWKTVDDETFADMTGMTKEDTIRTSPGDEAPLKAVEMQ